MFQFRFDDLQPYNKSLKCFPVLFMSGKERPDVDRGGKIILPGSALEHLTKLHIQFPMLFKLINKAKNRETHCGVLEFVAEEGRCYLPYWMMKNLLLKEGEIIQVQYVNLEIARFAKFQPQSVDFLEISNPKAVLENALRNFACLTKGDIISINYNEKDYELCILETRPGEAVSIIECDMDVDFAPPIGYEEPTTFDKNKTKSSSTNNLKNSKEYIGYRLDGKKTKLENCANRKEEENSNQVLKSKELYKGTPNYNYVFGSLNLNWIKTNQENKQNDNANEAKGHKLKNI